MIENERLYRELNKTRHQLHDISINHGIDVWYDILFEVGKFNKVDHFILFSFLFFFFSFSCFLFLFFFFFFSFSFFLFLFVFVVYLFYWVKLIMSEWIINETNEMNEKQIKSLNFFNWNLISHIIKEQLIYWTYWLYAKL